MSNDKQSDYKQQIHDWISANTPNPATFDNDTLLLEKKILTSVQIMDLILYLEHLQQKPLDIDQVQPENFVSINAIYTAFFTE